MDLTERGGWPYAVPMRELRAVYQSVIILDSLLILALVVVVTFQPGLRNLLVVAALLAGVNAMLHSRTLDGLRPGLKRLLLLGGLIAVLFVGVIGVVGFLR